MDEKVRILRNYTRMCKSKNGCHNCELRNELEDKGLGCFGRVLKHTERAVEIIERWAKEHPEKTYLQDVLEKFPKMELRTDGVPYYCRQRLYGEGIGCDLTKIEKSDCVKCWNKFMEAK